MSGYVKLAGNELGRERSTCAGEMGGELRHQSAVGSRAAGRRDDAQRGLHGACRGPRETRRARADETGDDACGARQWDCSGTRSGDCQRRATGVKCATEPKLGKAAIQREDARRASTRSAVRSHPGETQRQSYRSEGPATRSAAGAVKRSDAKSTQAVVHASSALVKAWRGQGDAVDCASAMRALATRRHGLCNAQGCGKSGGSMVHRD